ncbi:MAG: hypothetical protein HY778_03635 [Betaproteobacteria bacterium]|nr:hypothetical protein [Betaproteobacteria bacterium]
MAAATDFLIPAIGMLDGRYRDFGFDLKRAVTDNCQSWRFVAGERVRG